jgi:hypothetical protein
VIAVIFMTGLSSGKKKEIDNRLEIEGGIVQ